MNGMFPSIGDIVVVNLCLCTEAIAYLNCTELRTWEQCQIQDSAGGPQGSTKLRRTITDKIHLGVPNFGLAQGNIVQKMTKDCPRCAGDSGEVLEVLN